MAKLGLQLGLHSGQYCKRQHRWMFIIDDIAGDFSASREASVLPPLKSARPNITFKEMNVKHLFEDVYYPAKPDWKPIAITLYDLKKNIHPVFEWLTEMYDPKRGTYTEPNAVTGPNEGFIRQCTLQLYDGCGSTIESWIFEDCWPQSINFQTLDFGQDGIVMCDLTLRYARSYIDESNGQRSGG